jgi:competence protein ComEA
MRPRGSAHADAVSRRLELLSAELAAVRGEADPPDATAGDAAADAWPAPDLHTHLREDRSVGPRPPVPPSPPLATAPSAPEDPEEDPPPAPPAAPPVPVPGRHARRRRWSPGSLLAGRVALGPGQAAALAVLAAAALAVTAWWVVRDHGEPLALPAGPASGASPAALATGAATPPGASPGLAPGGATEVVVDVAGKVRRPGIVVLDPGDRVVDALEAAGGARPGADLTGLNLARLLVDGEQILVGVPPVPGIAASAAGSPGPDPGPLVDLNTAGLEQLDTLPGVGPVTAQSILDWRAAHGGFQSVDQLLDVDGIGEKTLADLAPLVTV